MRTNLLRPLASSTLAALALALTATGVAQTVTTPNPNLTISWNYDNNGTVNPGDLAGLAPATNWNNSWPNNPTTAMPDNTGTPTTLDLNYYSFNGWSIGSHPGYDANGTANRELLNGFMNTGFSTWEGPGFVTNNILNFTNVPYARYDVIVYLSDDTSGRHYTIDDGNGRIFYGATMGSAEVSGANALFVPAISTNGSSFPQADFAVFSGETSSNLTITETPKSGADQWIGLAGFQIVQSSNTYVIYGPSPANQIVPVGQAASFSVIAGGLNAAYQWRHNGNPIGTATNAAYTIPATALGQDGNYDVVITNSFSSVTSAVATLTFYTPKTLTWDGNGFNWDTTSAFWTLNGGVSTTNYTETDNVRFDPLGLAQSSVTLNADLTPSSITVSNASYVFTGGPVIGSGDLRVVTHGNLILDMADNSSGAINIDSTSTLQVGNYDGLGVVGSGTLTNNGALNFALNTAFAYGYPINGTGDVIDSGTGQITLGNTVHARHLILNATGGSYLLQGNNDLTGGILISNGVVLCRSAGCLGAAPVAIYPGGELQFTFITATYVGSSMNLAGGLLHDTSGSIFDGPVSVTADSTIQVDAGTLTLANGISGNDFNLTKNGNGTVALGGTDNSWYSLTINSGTVAFDSAANLSVTSSIAGGGNLSQIGSGTVTVTGDLSQFVGLTIVAAGTFASPTTNGGAVYVEPGATLEAGTPSAIGTMTINNGLTLGGNVQAKVNRSLVQSNDLFSVPAGVSNTNNGVVMINNLGPALHAGDTFTLFSSAVNGGDTLAVLGGGVIWTNNLATDGSITVISTTVPHPLITGATLTGGSAFVFQGNAGYPHAPFAVLMSTNLSTPSWTPVATGAFDSTGAFAVTNTITPGAAQAFYRLMQ
jgi:hypothetical protein